ncbi:MAG: glycosyltransferase family 4 protein [Candidatus Andersenbacteria bacterium]
MKIAIVTAQSPHASTMIGRIFPLAEVWRTTHQVEIIGLASVLAELPPHFHVVGTEPFSRTPQGKRRLKGWRLLTAMALAAIWTAWKLKGISPEIVIISKPLPTNVAGVTIWYWFNRHAKIVLDVDDFELTANHLSSLLQRAAVHWSERQAARMSSLVVAASPFLVDHFEQLKGGRGPIQLIPTGFTLPAPVPSTKDTAVKLLYLGSVSISSGHRVDLLPTILKLVRQQEPGVALDIIGSGDDVGRLTHAFMEAGVETGVTWAGRFKLQELPQLIHENYIVIDPIDDSIAQRAKSSFRVAVAAAYGQPVVTSNIGIRPAWLPQSLHERFFAKPADAADYARHIVDILRQPLHAAERERMQQHATQYRWEQLGRSYQQLLATL